MKLHEAYKIISESAASSIIRSVSKGISRDSKRAIKHIMKNKNVRNAGLATAVAGSVAIPTAIIKHSNNISSNKNVVNNNNKYGGGLQSLILQLQMCDPQDIQCKKVILTKMVMVSGKDIENLRKDPEISKYL